MSCCFRVQSAFRITFAHHKTFAPSSEVCKAINSTSLTRFLILLEVLVGAELTEQSEHDVQALYHWFVICKLVAGNIYHRANKASIIRWVHINFRTREWNILECLLHLLRPFLHQVVYIRHLLGIIHCRRRPCFVQILHTIDPARDLFRFFVCMFNWFDVHRSCANNVTLLNISELYHGFVFRI